MAQKQYIKYLYEVEGKNLAEIQKATGFNYRTVQKYAYQENWSEESLPVLNAENYPSLGAYIPIIDTWLEDDCKLPRKQRHTAWRVFCRLRDEHGFTLAALHQEKLETKSRLDHLQNELRQVNSEYESAQEEISRLAYSRKQEVDPDDFQFFLDGISKLTPTEHKVFDLYLDGKSAKDFMAILGITENTRK